MPSSESSRSARSVAVVCLVLAAVAARALVPLPAIEASLEVLLIIAAILAAGFAAWRGLSFWPVVALLPSTYVVAAAGERLLRTPTLPLSAIDRLMTGDYAGAGLLWDVVLAPVLCFAIAAVAVGTLVRAPANRRRIVSIAVAAVVCAFAGPLGWLMSLQEGEREAAAAVARAEAERKLAAANAIKDDAGMRLWPAGLSRAPSAWVEGEKKFYAGLFAKSQFPLVVVPCQVSGFALDRASRSLMSAMLTRAISSQTGAELPDSYLVARALGDGERRLANDDVYRFATAVQARGLLWCFAGHDRKGRMDVRLRLQKRGATAWSASAESASRAFDGIAFTDEDPPIDAFRRVLPQAVAFVTSTTPELVTAPKAPAPVAWPELPAGFSSTPEGPAAAARLLQVMAMTTPTWSNRARERFAEKALLLLQEAPADTADLKALTARAYMQLGLRPAALRVLGTPASVEERFLHALLNGNLPDVEREAAGLPSDRQLPAQLELNDIATDYATRNQKQAEEAAKRLKIEAPTMKMLVERAFLDFEPWAQFDNAAVKARLDADMPVDGYTLQAIVQSSAMRANRQALQAEVDTAVTSHARKYLEANAGRWCCRAQALAPTGVDYLELMESVAIDNLMRRAAHQTHVQGNAQGALELITAYETVYKDHPRLAYERGRARLALGSRAEGAAREALMSAAYGDLTSAFFWEQGQTFLASMTVVEIQRMQRGDYGFLNAVYAGDHPFRPHYATREGGGVVDAEISNATAATRNATYEFRPVATLRYVYEAVLQSPEKLDELGASIENRFRGLATRALMMAEVAESRADLPLAERLYREAVAQAPSVQRGYDRLGRFLFRAGKPEEALQTVLAFPGLKPDAGENAVGLANYLGAAGQTFYQGGQLAGARRLFELAARLNTGADAELSSASALAVMKGDLRSVAGIEQGRIARYGSATAYRDMFGLLHAMDGSAEIWKAFPLVARQNRNPEIWDTVLVGHRRAGLDEAAVVAWAAQDAIKAAGPQAGFSAAYAVRAATADRQPSAQLGDAIAAFETPVVVRGGRVLLRTGEGPRGGELLAIVDPKNLPSGPPLAPGEERRIASDLQLFSKGYRLLLEKDYAGASAVFQEAIGFYDATVERVGYLLPYFAFASARAGNTAAVEKILTDTKPSEFRFDQHLARAVISGLSKKTGESIASLRTALFQRPATGTRPVFTEYQLAETAEWLFEATGQAKFREFALEWARASQTMAPWQAWPHAIVAKLSTNPSERRRAIGMASYLDKESRRLKTLPAKEVEAAAASYHGENPFLKLQASAQQGTTVR